MTTTISLLIYDVEMSGSARDQLEEGPNIVISSSSSIFSCIISLYYGDDEGEKEGGVFRCVPAVMLVFCGCAGPTCPP